jgi:ppGpp synthetase/RelA/SpoT-type nucleotidyltranferase
MNFDDLDKQYRLRHNKALLKMAKKIEAHLQGLLTQQPRIDRIVARAKSPERFIGKAQKTIDKGQLKYSDPLNQIQDQIGARIVTFYNSDIDPLSKKIKDYLSPIEEQVFIPDSVNEFGYEGIHYILFIPTELFDKDIPKELCPTFFELQIKTLFEHSWAEANHDLAYKPDTPLTPEQKRKIAFTAAQAWGADNIFDDLFRELHKN